MFIIKKIEVDGFWGNYKIIVDLYEDINIFIGVNGSGKTTFINLLEATLTGDVSRLATFRFKKIKVQLGEGSHTRSITVEKTEATDTINFRIGTYKYDFPFISRNRDIHRNPYYGYNNGFQFQMDNLKGKLRELLNLSYLSVHRNLDKKEKEIIEEQLIQQNPVDARLTDLMGKLTSFQLQLQSEVNDLSKQFQRDILKLMLYNPKYDEIEVETVTDIDLDKLNKGLTQAYKDLGLLDEGQKQFINDHLTAIKKAVDKINKYNNKEEKGLFVNDVTVLTLMKRTERIVELSSVLEQKRNVVFEPINSYIKITKEFISNKELKFNNSKKDSLSFTKEKREFLPSQLSSGEKQLLILFTEALLQKKSTSIFIADEPELSLHISWQKRIISTLKQLNPNAQLILATHSPEIVGPLRSKTINMNAIVYGE